MAQVGLLTGQSGYGNENLQITFLLTGSNHLLTKPDLPPHYKAEAGYSEDEQKKRWEDSSQNAVEMFLYHLLLIACGKLNRPVWAEIAQVKCVCKVPSS